MTLAALTAADALEGVRCGRITSRDLVTACLKRIEETDGTVKAWAYLNPEQALAQAEEMDAIRRRGLALGALHGLPVGIKDIFDTADMPTQRGTPIHAGRQPDRDCAVVSRLREAGAVIMGKTATTEFAFMHPSETTNPHNPAHGPGGSSSGSAAAVAAGHVPLAIGSQTNGSTIRPASFCGVYGFKPTHGMISRHGVMQQSETLDQVGVFARSLEDVAMVSDALTGFDPADPKCYARPKPVIRQGLEADPPVEPLFAWMDLPYHDRLSADARAGFEELIDSLGDRVERIPVPAILPALIKHHQTVQCYETARSLAPQAEADWDRMSAPLQALIETGRGISDAAYADARAMIAPGQVCLHALFEEFDAILSPAAAGESPKMGEGTGDPIFCTIWTFCGLPSLGMPILQGATGLPIGAQLVGALETDARLFRSARWLEHRLAVNAAESD